MAQQKGGKLCRTQTVTIRLDPKTKYLAELAALKHRRTLSSFIEWSIEQSIGSTHLEEADSWGNHPTITEEANALWDVDEPDRFVKLALRHLNYLTFDQQKLWKLICSEEYLWKGLTNKVTGKWKYEIAEKSYCFERGRECWATLVAVSNGEMSPDHLPSARRSNDIPSVEATFNEDNLPF